jgi:hypothetical protein
MANGYLFRVDEMQKITGANQVVGRLHLPPGKYIIFGKANAAALKLNGSININQALECRITGGGEEDSILLNLWSEGSDGGNWGTIALNMSVTLETSGKIEMLCTPGIPGDILLFNVVISAIQVDNISVDKEKQVPQHENVFGRISDAVIYADVSNLKH